MEPINYPKLTKEELTRILLDECVREAPDLDTIRKLVEHGADYRASDTSGRSAFQWAARHLRADVVKLFLELGADPNAPKYEYDDPAPVRNGTIWMQGLRWASSELIHLYFRHGADVNARDNDGNTPLIWYVWFRDKTDVELIGEFIARGADVNAANAEGDTTLHWALRSYNNAAAVTALLDADANPNLPNHQGKTPLHVAVESHFVDAHENVALLLRRGADPNAGLMPPLFSAVCLLREPARDQIVTLLLAHGADSNRRDELGKSPYDHAIGKGFASTAELIGAHAKSAFRSQPDSTEIAEIKQKIIAKLRGGGFRQYANKEEHGELYFDPKKNVYVCEMYDSLVLEPEKPERVAHYTTDNSVLASLYGEQSHRLRESQTTERDVWESVLQGLFTGPYQKFVATPRPAIPEAPPGEGILDPAAVVGEQKLASGGTWTAAFVKTETTFVGGREWPHVYYAVQAQSAAGEEFRFEWKFPFPADTVWQKQGAFHFKQELQKRVTERLHLAEKLNFTAPQPLPNVGTWTAKHTSRFEDESRQLRFLITVTTKDGHVTELEHTLAHPGTERWEQEIKAARTRLTKWLRKKLDTRS